MARIDNVKDDPLKDVMRRLKDLETARSLTNAAFDYDELETTTDPPNVNIGLDGIPRRCE